MSAWLYQLDETGALRLAIGLADRASLPAPAILLEQLAAAGLKVRRYGDQASLDQANGGELPISLVRAFASYQQEFSGRLIALGARNAAAWTTAEQTKIPDPDPRDQERGREGERPRRWRGGAAARLKDDDA
jgi:hypothetical protein